MEIVGLKLVGGEELIATVVDRPFGEDTSKKYVKSVRVFAVFEGRNGLESGIRPYIWMNPDATLGIPEHHIVGEFTVPKELEDQYIQQVSPSGIVLAH